MSTKQDLNIEEIIADMKNELYTLHAERSAIDGRMDKIKKALMGLATLYGDEALSVDFLQSKNLDKSPARGGLTAACRLILKEAKLPLRTSDIHQLIIQQRPEALRLHKEPYAAIAAVLQRLAKRGDAYIITKGRGRTEWTWHNGSPSQDSQPLREETDSVPARGFDGPSALERKPSAG
jgi:hypothetical protein